MQTDTTTKAKKKQKGEKSAKAAHEQKQPKDTRPKKTPKPAQSEPTASTEPAALVLQKTQAEPKQENAQPAPVEHGLRAIVQKQDFLALVQRCQHVADKKSTLPVLACVRIEAAAQDRLRLSATDFATAVQGELPAEVQGDGSVAVGARDLFERVRAMPEGPIAIASTPEGTLTLMSGSAPRRFRIHGIPGGGVPCSAQTRGRRDRPSREPGSASPAH